jgi:hypothetical protein
LAAKALSEGPVNAIATPAATLAFRKSLLLISIFTSFSGFLIDKKLTAENHEIPSFSPPSVTPNPKIISPHPVCQMNNFIQVSCHI